MGGYGVRVRFRVSVRFKVRVRFGVRVSVIFSLFEIIPMHMMTREIIPGRKTEGSTVSSINCNRSSLI